MLDYDESFGYSMALLSVAPFATQLGLAPISWIPMFPIFALPAISLLLSIGHLSTHGPVLTFRRIAPISAGLGWAFTWHVSERLYVEGLRAAQYLLYIIFSIRTYLDWAVDCRHSYNSQFCTDFNHNATVIGQYEYPNIAWPAQEFNSYLIRGNPIPEKHSSQWKPNEWFLGISEEKFSLSWPSMPLMIAHTIIWTSLYIVLVRFSQRLGTVISRICVLLPCCLYATLILGMSISGFHFGTSVRQELSAQQRENDSLDFWTDVRGLYRTSLLIVDYSGAFTGLLLFATSRLRPGSSPLNSLLLVPMMMVVPLLLTILRSGCEGHVADIQPAYKTYLSTDETISFDLMPVCFALSSAGPLWAFIYYVAQLLYTSLGPMIVYTSFIYQSFADDFPNVQNHSPLVYVIIIIVFAVPSVLLYMPQGTKITTLFRYASQSSIIQIFSYVIIYFVYGWQTVETDILTTTNDIGSVSAIQYLIRPTSPIYTTLMFTVVPALLCSKFSAVFDLLMNGKDIVTHINAGASFISPTPIRWVVGYAIMFAPTFIVIVFIGYTIYNMMVRHKLPFSEILKPTSDWMAHSAVNISRVRSHSLAYGLFNSLFTISYNTALFGLFVIEMFFGVAIFSVFVLNSISVIGVSSGAANNYRSLMLFIIVILHGIALLEMRTCQLTFDSPYRLSLYIGVATMEMAMLNGYMWMFAADHISDIDLSPLMLIVCNTIIRGACIILAIAIRAHLRDQERPMRTRDVTEICEVDTVLGMDAEDDTPIIFDLARA